MSSSNPIRRFEKLKREFNKRENVAAITRTTEAAKIGEVSQSIEPILKKYEKLGLTNSSLYFELKNNLKDQV